MMVDIILASQGFSIAFDSPGFDVLVTFAYSRDEPLSVRAYIQDVEEPQSGQEWIFARDILINGLQTQTGESWVTVRPVDDEFLSLTVSSDDGRLEVFLPLEAIRFFVEQTLMLVPQHEEKIIIPDTVAELLGN